MQMLVSEDGNGLLALESPGALAALGVGPGDVVDVTVRVSPNGTRTADSVRRARIIIDARTGLPALTLGEGAPKITSEMVAEMLAEFP